MAEQSPSCFLALPLLPSHSLVLLGHNSGLSEFMSGHRRVSQRAEASICHVGVKFWMGNQENVFKTQILVNTRNLGD